MSGDRGIRDDEAARIMARLPPEHRKLVHDVAELRKESVATVLGHLKNLAGFLRSRQGREEDAMSAAPTFKEVDEARYNEMLGVLPPALWLDKGFLVGEPYDHRRCKETGGFAASFAAFIRYRGKYYESEEAMTAAEFRAFDPSTLL